MPVAARWSRIDTGREQCSIGHRCSLVDISVCRRRGFANEVVLADAASDDINVGRRQCRGCRQTGRARHHVTTPTRWVSVFSPLA